MSKIFNSWILFMSKCTWSIKKLYLHLQVLKTIQILKVSGLHKIFMQSPHSVISWDQIILFTLTIYIDTFWVIVGVCVTDAVILSKLWPVFASDVELTRCRRLLYWLEKGDAVIVDNGFIHMRSGLKPTCVQLNCPPFK